MNIRRLPEIIKQKLHYKFDISIFINSQLNMLFKIRIKIEEKRNSKNYFWKTLTALKDVFSTLKKYIIQTRKMNHIIQTRKKNHKCRVLRKNGLKVLQDAYVACNKLGIKAFLTDGTLLGHHRENGFINHDSDIDLGILEPDINKVSLLSKEMEIKGYRIKQKDRRISFKKHGPHVCLYYFFKRNNSTFSMYLSKKDTSVFRYDYPISSFKKFETARFADKIDVLVPGDIDAYLTAGYGDWTIPKKKRYVFEPNLRIEKMKAVIFADKKGSQPDSIKNLLYLLEINGIIETIIVTGYQGDYVRSEINKEPFPLKIQYVMNDKFLQSNSGYSLYLTRGLINNNTVLIESQSEHDKYTLKKIIRSKHRNAIMVKKKIKDKDAIRICAHEDKIVDIGRYIPDKDTGKIAGASLGISRFSKTFLLKYFEIAEQDFQNNKFNTPSEEYLRRIVENGEYHEDLNIIRQ